MEVVNKSYDPAVDIGRLRPHPLNPRVGDLEAIAESVDENGFYGAVVAQLSTGFILVGNHRYKTAVQKGAATVPVIWVDCDDDRAKRILLVDNRTNDRATYDRSGLAQILAGLREETGTLAGTGFDGDYLQDLLKELENERQPKAGQVNEDDCPELPETAVTQPGDLWILGEHRLLCGDATKLEDIYQVLGGALADMCFTDPPYNLSYEGKTAKKLTIKNDALGSQFLPFLKSVCAGILEVTKGAVYICMAPSELPVLHQTFKESGGHFQMYVIWAKNHFTLGHMDYQRQYEPILYGWKEGIDHFWCGDRDQGDVWFIDRPTRSTVHPTMKPVALAERAIQNSSKTRDIVLDLFGGSGTTLIACEKLRRQARLIELDPKYCDVIVQRYQQHSGNKAVRETAATITGKQ